jgi:hypothetical protein
VAAQRVIPVSRLAAQQVTSNASMVASVA